jgi:magnesium chelatase subunit I
VTVVVPDAMTDIIATLSHLARDSAHVNQRSGVSVRLSVSNLETMVANAMRRALRAGETEVVPRVSDLDALAASTSGKVEIESLEDGREGEIVDHLIRAAVLTVFRERVRPETLLAVVEAFEEREPVECGEDISSAAYVGLCESMPALAEAVSDLVGEPSSPARVASAVELVLEGLHLSKRLNKDAVGARSQYRARR